MVLNVMCYFFETRCILANVEIWEMNIMNWSIWSAGKSFYAFMTLSAKKFDVTEMLL